MRPPIGPHIILFIFLSLSAIRSVYGGEKGAYLDTLHVTGANTEHLSRYVNYWIDSSLVNKTEQVDSAFAAGKFKRWPTNETINIGLNPYPLWLHLTVKSVADYPRTFWWSLYNQADTVLVYNKKEDGMFACIDTLSYNIPRSQRRIPTRFQAIPLHFDPGEHKTIFVKVINLRTPQYFVTDLTTPADNLFWEKDFYWSVGIFAGCFVVMISMCLLLAFFTRQVVFWIYTGYLLLVFFLILYQELLITSIPKDLF